MPTEAKIYHGVLMQIFSLGVLIEGPSGIGKSDLALELINRGHKLIADDAPEFYQSHSKIIGICPTPIRDFLSVRNLGLIDVKKTFGASQVKYRQQLDLIVELDNINSDDVALWNQYNEYQSRKILNTEIDIVKIYKSQHRNLALLLETSVKKQELKLSGYDTHQAFIKQSQKYFESAN